MDLLQSLRTGELDAAAGELSARVKAEPGNVEHRYGLVAVLTMRGEFERAQGHLDAIAAQDAATLPGVQAYRSLLDSEIARRGVWKGIGAPELPQGADGAAATRAALPAALARGDEAALAAGFAALAAEAPVPCTVNGTAAASLRDSDDLLGPMLEVFAGGRYHWQPLNRTRALTLMAPTTLLDLIWARAELTDASGRPHQVHVPVLYPETSESQDGLLRAGRKSEWAEVPAFGYRGVGGRVLYRDEEEIELLAVREVVFGSPATSRP